MKPKTLQRRVSILKYHLDEAISSSDTQYTDEQLSGILTKYFTGLQLNPDGKRYIKGKSKSVVLPTATEPKALTVGIGSPKFNITVDGDTTVFESGYVQQAGEAPGVKAKYRYTITKNGTITTHTFTQTRAIGDEPTTEEAFIIDLDSTATYGAKLTPKILQNETVYSRVNPLAPKVPVVQPFEEVIPTRETSLIPVTQIPLQTFVNSQGIRFSPSQIQHQGGNIMPNNEELGFDIIDPNTGRVITQGTRTRKPTSQNDNPGTAIIPVSPVIRHDNNDERQETGIIPVRNGGVSTTGNRFRVRRQDPIILDEEDVIIADDHDNDGPIVIEDNDELSEWERACRTIEEENRRRKLKGQKPLKMPRKPKTIVKKKGKKPVNNPSKLKKVLKVVGKVLLAVAVAAVVIVTAVFGKLHYDKYLDNDIPTEYVEQGNNNIQDDFLPEDGIVETLPGDGLIENEDQTPGGGGDGVVVTPGTGEEVPVINPNVPPENQDDFIKNPTGGIDNPLGPADEEDEEDIVEQEDEDEEEIVYSFTGQDGKTYYFTYTDPSTTTGTVRNPNNGSGAPVQDDPELGQ